MDLPARCQAGDPREDVVASVVARSRNRHTPPPLWTVRWIESTGLPPALGGVGIAASVYAVFLLYSAVLGEGVGRIPGVRVHRQWASEILFASIIAFVPVITALTLRGTRRDFAALRPFLRGSGPHKVRLLERITSCPMGPLRLVGFVAATGAALVVTLDPTLWTAGRLPAPTDPALAWLIGRNALEWWLVSRGVWLEIELARSFSTLGREISDIDLLDTSALRPFARRGLRSVLLWMGFASLHSVLYVADWVGDWITGLLGLLLVSIVGLALASFLLPVIDVHRRIRQAKEVELERVRAALRSSRKGALASGPDDPAAARLGDLVAWEARIREVSEWPFDTPTLLRFALYVSVALGSWLGGALVERALDLALR